MDGASGLSDGERDIPEPTTKPVPFLCERGRVSEREYGLGYVKLTEEQREKVAANLGLAGLVTRRLTPLGHAVGMEPDDIFQVAAIGIMRAVVTHDPKQGTIGSWGYHCAMREVRSFVRKYYRDRHVFERVDKVVSGTTEIDTFISEEEAEYLLRILPPRWRQAVRLIIGLGVPAMDYRSAARVLGVSKQRVQQIWSKAMERLQALT